MTIAAIVNKTVHPWLVFPAELLEPLVAAKQRIKYACLKYNVFDTGYYRYLRLLHHAVYEYYEYYEYQP